MNRKQRRITQSKDKHRPVIKLHGKSCTVEEAIALAAEASRCGHFQAAADMYGLILSKVHDRADIYNSQGITLHAMKRYDEALANYDQAMRLDPDQAQIHDNRAITLRQLKRYDEALASCNAAITLKPDDVDAHQLRGATMADKGDMQEAERMFVKALALKPDYPKAWFSLSQIRHYKNAEHADCQIIRSLLSNPGALPDKDYLYFALGKIYDDCGLYDDAFASYRQANQLLSAAGTYHPQAMTEYISRIIDVFNRDFLAQRFAFASGSRLPLLIVGMPRSGTTLVASMLSNHSAIGTAGELTTLSEFTSRLPQLTGNIPYPQAAGHITPGVASQIIQSYEHRLKRDVGAGPQYIIDKYPFNFMHLGLVAMLFPNASIVHCMRHPLDVGLSNYFRRFLPDYTYSFDLRSIGHFYGEYARLMEHWQKVLPGRMINVRYEDMIINTESTARTMLDFLGLEWEERCLAPHTNRYPVDTPSKWQVRQPIYTQSIARWKHYEKHLVPLKEALQSSGQLPD